MSGRLRIANKDMAQLLEKARSQGFVANITNGGHVRVKCPDGSLIYDTATRLDPRGFYNFRQLQQPQQLQHLRSGLRG